MHCLIDYEAPRLIRENNANTSATEYAAAISI